MNEKDHIKEQFRSLLNNYEAPVTADGWERLEKSLVDASRTRLLRRRWISAAAVIVALMVGGIVFLKNPVSTTEPSLTEAIDNNFSAGREEGSAAGRSFPLSDDAGRSENSQEIISPSRQKNDVIFIAEGKSKNGASDVILSYLRKQRSRISVTNKSEDVSLPQLQKRKDTETFRADEKDKIYITEEFTEQPLQNKLFGRRKQDEKHMYMLALNGRGGLGSSQRTANAPMMLRSAAVSVNTPDNFGGKQQLLEGYSVAENAENVPDNISEMQHAQPVSFGITVSKSISDRVSLETGLVYTYLFSEAKNTTNEFRNQETQKLH